MSFWDGSFRVKEEVFWRNYFYRVSLIKQSAQLTALAAQQSTAKSVTKNANPDDGGLEGTRNIDVLTVVTHFSKVFT